MTTITFYKTDGFYYGFEEQGHTGYGESGEDILCSALSSMTMLLINAIEVSYDCVVDYTIDEKTTDIRVIAKSALPKYEKDEKKQFAVSGLIQAYFFQLMDLVEDYYEFLDVKEIEKHILESQTESKVCYSIGGKSVFLWKDELRYKTVFVVFCK